MMKKITEEMAQQYEDAWNQGAQAGEIDKLDPNTGQPLQVPPVVNVNDWDNHAVHMEVHNRFRKSQAFQGLPDVVKAEFQKHVSIHEQILQKQAELQMMMQSGMPQQGPAAGGQMQQGLPEQTGFTDEQLG
jgi:hypothetical protein